MVDTQTLASSNTDPSYAKVGDTLTLTFTVSDTLQATPTAAIAGETVTVTASGSTYTAVYTVTATTPEGPATHDNRSCSPIPQETPLTRHKRLQP